MDPRAEVKNAADPQQVQRASRKEDRREAFRLAGYADVLATVQGRLVFWDLLEQLGVFRSVMTATPERTAYMAGWQDAGHLLMATLLAADDAAYLLMETEARARKKRDADATDAGHTPAAEGAE